MFKKFFIFLFTVFLTVNCYSDKGIITVQERCQIAYKNLELLNNPHKQVYIREDGKLRELYYSEVLAQRAENEEIIRKFCNKTVEEKTSDSAKYQTRQYEPSTVTAFRNAVIARNKDEALTLLDILSLDYRLEETIRQALERDDFTAALTALDEEQSEDWGQVLGNFDSENACEQEKMRLNEKHPDKPRLHCEKRGRVWVLTR